MARKAKPPAGRTVEALRHEEAMRRNIPTAECQSVLEQAAQYTVRVAYERRNRDLDPQLVWRGKDGKGDLFVIFGEPDVTLLPAEGGRLRIKANGVDVFDPSTGEVRSDGPDGIACWFIDTDYELLHFLRSPNGSRVQFGSCLHVVDRERWWRLRQFRDSLDRSPAHHFLWRARRGIAGLERRLLGARLKRWSAPLRTGRRGLVESFRPAGAGGEPTPPRSASDTPGRAE